MPIKTIRVKNKHLPWFDQELRDAIKFRDELFVLMKTFSIDKNDPVWNEWRIIRNECKSLQRKKMCKYFSQKTNEYKGDFLLVDCKDEKIERYFINFKYSRP